MTEQDLVRVRSALSPRLAGPREVPATLRLPRLLIAESWAQASQPARGSYLQAAGRQPRDVPTHGSPAAARQANGRVRPRAAVSGPAHRPRPAQLSAPAPAGDPASTPRQDPDSCPHAGLLVRLGTRVLPAGPSSAPHTDSGSFQESGQTSVGSHSEAGPAPSRLSSLFHPLPSPEHPAGSRMAWLPSPPPRSSLCPSLSGLSCRWLAPAPGLGTVVPSRSLRGWALQLPPQKGSPEAAPSHGPGTLPSAA